MQPLANSIAAIKARARGEAPASAKNDAAPANLDDPYEYIMHVFNKHIKPVIESGTYESDGFGPASAAYLDAALSGSADRPPPGCDRVRSMLCLAAKLKARRDSIDGADINGSDGDRLLYAISNAMTWLTHFADRDLAMFAAVLMQKVLRLPVSPDKVPHHFWGYIAPSMRHDDKMAMMRVGMALEKIEAWLAGRYESGDMDWIFKMPGVKVENPDAGNPAAIRIPNWDYNNPPVPANPTRRCHGCRTEKPSAEFPADMTSRETLPYLCRTCNEDRKKRAFDS